MDSLKSKLVEIKSKRSIRKELMSIIVLNKIMRERISDVLSKKRISKKDIDGLLSDIDLIEKTHTRTLPKDPIVVPENYGFCTWCKSKASNGAVKYIAFDKIFERPVCDDCKNSLWQSIIKDQKN